MTFSPCEFNNGVFQHAMHALREAIEAIHRRDGLAAALEWLNEQQAGLLKDTLENVTIKRLENRLDRSEWFNAQFNPGRRDRHHVKVLAKAPPGCVPMNANCVLDVENIRWQQNGVQLAYPLTLNGVEFLSLVNPFRLKPAHFTVAARAHIPQRQHARRVAGDIVALASELGGGRYTIWNGPKAGATVPEHYHLQVLGGGPFPLDDAAAVTMPGRGLAIVDNYPLPAVAVRGNDPDIILDTVAAVADRWSEVARAAATANIIGTCIAGDLVVYYVPRHTQYATAPGIDGQLASLEALGEIVLESLEHEEALKSGRIDYRFVQRALASVRPPMVDFLFAQLGDLGGRLSKAS